MTPVPLATVAGLALVAGLWGGIIGHNIGTQDTARAVEAAAAATWNAAIECEYSGGRLSAYACKFGATIIEGGR